MQEEPMIFQLLAQPPSQINTLLIEDLLQVQPQEKQQLKLIPIEGEYFKHLSTHARAAGQLPHYYSQNLCADHYILLQLHSYLAALEPQIQGIPGLQTELEALIVGLVDHQPHQLEHQHIDESLMAQAHPVLDRVQAYVARFALVRTVPLSEATKLVIKCITNCVQEKFRRNRYLVEEPLLSPRTPPSQSIAIDRSQESLGSPDYGSPEKSPWGSPTDSAGSPDSAIGQAADLSASFAALGLFPCKTPNLIELLQAAPTKENICQVEKYLSQYQQISNLEHYQIYAINTLKRYLMELDPEFKAIKGLATCLIALLNGTLDGKIEYLVDHIAQSSREAATPIVEFVARSVKRFNLLCLTKDKPLDAIMGLFHYIQENFHSGITDDSAESYEYADDIYPNHPPQEGLTLAQQAALQIIEARVYNQFSSDEEVSSPTVIRHRLVGELHRRGFLSSSISSGTPSLDSLKNYSDDTGDENSSPASPGLGSSAGDA